MIYIDTGAFIARFLAKDQFHRQAITKWKKIQKSRLKCYTSNFVIDETLTLLARWSSYEFATEKGNRVYHSDAFLILRPDVSIEMRALELLRKFGDQKVSFTDCVSFSLMEQNKMNKVFSFNRHFSDAGFTLI